MKYLMDTHAFIWAVSFPEKLGERARQVIEDSGSTICISAASSWEIQIKIAIGKLTLPQDPEHFLLHNISKMNLVVLDITLDDTFEIGRLPPIHKDPFDRVLIAQGRNRAIPIITKDPSFAGYPVETIW